MHKVILIGAGGHAAEIWDYIHQYNLKMGNTYIILGLLDDDSESYSSYEFKAPLLGTIKDHKINSKAAYIIAIANLKYRKAIVDSFILKGANFISFIHYDAFVSFSATIGKGVVIAPNVNIGPKVIIGDFSLVNSRASIGHDTVIGVHNFISPNVCLSGFSKVGNENLFGINSATIPNIRIGDRNKIAAGMVLDKNIKNDAVVFFRYKEKLIAVPR